MSSPVSIAPIAEAAATAERRHQIREAAEAFEALFLQTLIKKMRESQIETGLFGQGAGSGGYESMFDQMLGERLADGSPLGIADTLEERWTGIPGKRAEALEAFRKAAASAAKVRGATADE